MAVEPVRRAPDRARALRPRHHEGASHGETRNYNNAYAEAHYLDLLALAREGWDALGDVDGEPLLRRHGLVSHGPGAALGAAPADAAWPAPTSRLGLGARSPASPAPGGARHPH
jgi:sarcosine oxidase